jgi:hypothetical protein
VIERDHRPAEFPRDEMAAMIGTQPIRLARIVLMPLRSALVGLQTQRTRNTRYAVT